MITSTQEYLKIPKGRKRIPFFQWNSIPKRANNFSPKEFPWATVEYARAAHMLHISIEIDKDGKLNITLQDPHIGSDIPIHNKHQLNHWIAKARRKKYRKWIRGCYNWAQITREENSIARETFEGPTELPRKYQHTKTRIAYLPKIMTTTARAYLRPHSTRNNVGDILQLMSTWNPIHQPTTRNILQNRSKQKMHMVQPHRNSRSHTSTSKPIPTKQSTSKIIMQTHHGTPRTSSS
jgi:hypothetical protein